MDLGVRSKRSKRASERASLLRFGPEFNLRGLFGIDVTAE